MRQSYSPKPSGRNRLKPRESISREQPLRPRKAGRALQLLTGIVVLSLVAFSVFRVEGVAGYFNPPVTSVLISKDFSYVKEGEVKALLAAYLGKGFFNLDLAGIKQQLESHPWIANAEVTRVWPDHLKATITEEVVIAKWGDGELLNQYSEVFKPPAMTNIPVLPQLIGPLGSQARMLEQFRQLNQKLFPAGLRLDRLSLSERGSWELGLGNGMNIVAGTVDVLDRVQRFIDIYDRRLGNDIAVIEWVDLRYPNGFTVRRHESNADGVAAR